MKTFKQLMSEVADDEAEDKAHFMHHAKKCAATHAKMYEREKTGKNMDSLHHRAEAHWDAIASRHGPEAADSVAWGTPNTDAHREAMFKKHCSVNEELNEAADGKGYEHYLHHAREYHNAIDSIDKAKTPKQYASREAKTSKHYAEIKKHHGKKLADALYHLPNNERERASAYKNY